VPENPFALTTETDVTVPEFVADIVIFCPTVETEIPVPPKISTLPVTPLMEVTPPPPVLGQLYDAIS
jgi:hypothetical protein